MLQNGTFCEHGVGIHSKHFPVLPILLHWVVMVGRFTRQRKSGDVGVEIHDVVVDVVDGIALSSLRVVLADESVQLDVSDERIWQALYSLLRQRALVPTQETVELLNTLRARRKAEEAFNAWRAEGVPTLQHLRDSEPGLLADFTAQMLLRDLLWNVLSAVVEGMHECRHDGGVTSRRTLTNEESMH